MVRKWCGYPAAAALMFSPTLVQAQDCSSLRASRDAADQRGRFLVEDNPGTALVAFGCMAAAKSNYDQRGNASDAAGSFAVCGAFGCGFTDSYSNCITVGTEIIYQAIRSVSNERQLRQLGCRP